MEDINEWVMILFLQMESIDYTTNGNNNTG